MQTKKILVVSLSLLLVGLALSTTNMNKAHAFTNGNDSVTISNVLNGFSSPTIGSGTVAQSASSLSFTIVIQASSFNNPAYQRNVTIGVKGDWMTAYQNASILTLTTSQLASTTLSVALPTVNAISPSHTWTVQAWDGPATGNVAGCTSGNGENYPGSGTPKSCFVLASGTVSILTADQYSAAQSRNAAQTAIVAAGSFLTDETARGQLAQATTERNLGDSSWTNGDFGGARTHYQNAQNDANAALATQVNLGGGSTNAGIVGALESGTGILLFGLGGLLAGLGGLFYLRRKPKA
ncbi:MAG: hypothetical protein AUI50_04480 [Crenarchaeota archaeon 13_1_40CM_2_52_14]|nr:MAG: hypothetical protein AUI97_08265 [Crenarchaeota archaeon 13_1_40CM_3_52_17]OLD34900.1 MAG: hypothetical protein AUI50_04480 [Crenarchaeota archaeon 13_1_40CM_2_52_14]OLE68733.1 MAG: hypothetical protein AUF78_14665 [archaeon 13_1_20CM_2_51_12]